MTLVTPSAKAHERVSGRWTRDFEAKTPKERALYYFKLAVGTPIPWLLWAYVSLAYISRAGVEIAAWSCALLTLAYIAADRLSSSREFRFFRIGADFFLLGFVLVTLGTAAASATPAEALATLGGCRWIFLLYMMAYCFELFPGLNKLFSIMMAAACGAAGYGIWQHFTGVDLLGAGALPSAPVKDHIYFVPSSFFGSPEIYGTLLAMALPLPAAAFLLDDRRDSKFGPWIALTFVFVMTLALLWSYRPGLWTAGAVALIVSIIMQGRNILSMLGSMVAFLAVVVLITYGSPGGFWDGVQASELERAERQRAQINTQVTLWQESPWIGVGAKAREAAGYDPGTGNVYFQMLAQSGVLGAAFYLLFVLAFLLATYRVFREIPKSHFWHRVLVSGGLSSQLAFHVSGLYWSTLSEALVLNLFVLMIAALGYLSEHYSRGIVSDDFSL
jgi:O-antigen ligase